MFVDQFRLFYNNKGEDYDNMCSIDLFLYLFSKVFFFYFKNSFILKIKSKFNR